MTDQHNVRRRTLLMWMLALALPTLGPTRATCTGDNPCNACKNCKYCKRCAKDGKTCGTCKRAMDESYAGPRFR